MAQPQPKRPLSKSSGGRSGSSIIKRTLTATSGPEAQKKRITIATRPSSAISCRNKNRGSSTGTPVPIVPCDDISQGQDDQDESFDHIILAIDQDKKTFGCAYYVARNGHLFCMQDAENPDKDAIEGLKLEIRPTTILMSPRIEVAQHELTNISLPNAYGGHDEVTLPYKVELRPSNDFKYELAIQKLAATPHLKNSLALRYLVPGEDEHNNQICLDEAGFTDHRGTTLHATSGLSLQSRISIGCAGAVITYLQKKRASEYLQDDPAADDAYQIINLQMFSFKDTMLITPDTLAALQILQPELHPNTAKQGPGSSGSKESLSMYGLFFHFAKTQQGRQQLRTMFVRPSTDPTTIRIRHESIAVLVRPENLEALQKLSKSLSRIKNIYRVVVQLQKGIEGGNSHTGSIKSGVWSSLLEFCYHIIDISETFNEITDLHQVHLHDHIRELFRREDFQYVGKSIFDLVDLEESHEQRRTVIKRGVDKDLDIVKDAYNRMDEMLTQTAIDTIPELPADMPTPSLTIVYIPQLGFHVTIPRADADLLIARGLNPDWERRFTTDASAYFKNRRMRTLDSELGDLWAQICETEIDISHGLAQRILERRLILVQASELCGQLDALLALAHGAIQYQLVRPTMVEENVIDIREGRHLIHEMTVPAYVANDTFLVGGNGHADGDVDIAMAPPEAPSMLLLTGPNYSGKSVYLKQVALIVYMAQVGSFVPAKDARLGITDKILTRITTRETVSKGQSSFMIDLQQIAYALKAFTSRTLLIVDEFGKGTNTCDGAGLAAGVLTYLLSLGNDAPKVLASTHFHEIFEQDIMEEGMPGLALKQMEVHVRNWKQADHTLEYHNSEVTYLYNVRPGRSTMSYGAQCATMNGIPQEIVDRARDLTDLSLAGKDLAAVCSVVSLEEADDLRNAEAISRAFLELDIDSLGENDVHNLKDILGTLINIGSTDSRSSTSHPVSPTVSSWFENSVASPACI